MWPLHMMWPSPQHAALLHFILSTLAIWQIFLLRKWALFAYPSQVLTFAHDLLSTWNLSFLLLPSKLQFVSNSHLKPQPNPASYKKSQAKKAPCWVLPLHIAVPTFITFISLYYDSHSMSALPNDCVFHEEKELFIAVMWVVHSCTQYLAYSGCSSNYLWNVGTYLSINYIWHTHKNPVSATTVYITVSTKAYFRLNRVIYFRII